jgi:hypothetical protein
MIGIDMASSTVTYGSEDNKDIRVTVRQIVERGDED